MKFMVMCSLEQAAGSPVEPRVVDGMVRLGLRPVGSSRSDEGLPFGLENAFVGDFRAGDARILESMLRDQVSAMLCRFGSGLRFKFCIVPTSASVPIRRQA